MTRLVLASAFLCLPILPAVAQQTTAPVIPTPAANPNTNKASVGEPGSSISGTEASATGLTPSVPKGTPIAKPVVPVTPVPPVAPSAAPIIGVEVNTEGSDYVAAIKIFFLMTLLSMAPAILMSVTSFTRIVIVLSLLRSAVGVQQLPPNKVILGLALFLSLFTMAPVIDVIDTSALTPYEAGEITGKEAGQRALVPLRDFMFQHTRMTDLDLFLELSGGEEPETIDDVSTYTLIPAFMLSELKTAFQMGAMMFLPFLIIDLVVASVLMSMGMMMLPPVMVSLPIKLFVFVLADGWALVVRSLAESVLMNMA